MDVEKINSHLQDESLKITKDFNEKLLDLLREHSRIDFKNQKELLASDYFSELTKQGNSIYHLDTLILEFEDIRYASKYLGKGNYECVISQRFERFF